jgi:hypothetical protein
MITAGECSDLIHIMEMNRLNLADSDSAQLEFRGHVNDKNYRMRDRAYVLSKGLSPIVSLQLELEIGSARK